MRIEEMACYISKLIPLENVLTWWYELNSMSLPGTTVLMIYTSCVLNSFVY